MRRTALLALTLILSFFLPVTGQARAGAEDTFVKLDMEGRQLPDEASGWVMVLDRTTGLIWEAKSDDGSIHDRDNLYSWKNTQKTFVKALNGEKLGGFEDWRLPEESELARLRDLKDNDPELFGKYFPLTAPSTYWSWSRCQDGSKNSVRLKFGPEPSEEDRQHRIRAVRGELKE